MRTTQGIYQHYKGGLYRLLFIAKDSTNGSPTADQDVAVYVSLNESGRVSVRLLAEFDGRVQVEGQSRPRFEWVGP